MSKIKFKIVISPPKPRNQLAVDAMSRRSSKFRDKRDGRRGAKSWRNQNWNND